MQTLKNKEKCSSCGKEFIWSIKSSATKMDDKRTTYYYCPYCNQVIGNITLLGNEEVAVTKIE